VQQSTLCVNAEQANSLALIINELTANSIKYALKGREEAHVQVHFTHEAHSLLLEFRDDGPGYPEDMLSVKCENIGLHLLQNLVEYELNGSVKFYNDPGAIASIRFKMIIEEERI
jgi:two-component sensor histidine kinase